MADTFGALRIPTVAPAQPPLEGDCVAAGDPFITYALSYFRAFLNAKAAPLWLAAGVAPNTALIQNTFPHDPAEHLFSGKNLPALYMWRAGGKPTEQLADDWLIQKDSITLLWVFPPAQDATQAKRRPTSNALTKLVTTAIEQNHDPSWTLPGDPDPRAAASGSDFAAWSGLHSCKSAGWKQSKLVVRGVNAADVYDTIEMTLEVEERQTRDVDGGDSYPNTSYRHTVQTADSPPLVIDQALVT